MFDSLVETFISNPYLGVAVVFLFCGAGLPLPEEIVLVAAGFVCFKGDAKLAPMMAACSVGILAGDMVPYVLGRAFGTRLLRLRYLRLWVTRRRLLKFDRWFRRRGDMVIIVARFLTGIRMVAYFTAGTLKMPWRRFLILDAMGIAVIVPPLVLIGYSGGEYIDQGIQLVRRIEWGILIAAALALIGVGVWYWLRGRGRLKEALGEVADTYVEPTIEPTEPPEEDLESQPSELESKES